MSELEQEMTRAECTRNALDADVQHLDRVAQGFASAAVTLSAIADDESPGRDAIETVGHAIWEQKQGASK